MQKSLSNVLAHTSPKSQAHLDAGAKKVLISALPVEMKTIRFITSMTTLTDSNDALFPWRHATNCLAPMAKALHDSFGIEVGTMTTIHASLLAPITGRMARVV